MTPTTTQPQPATQPVAPPGGPEVPGPPGPAWSSPPPPGSSSRTGVAVGATIAILVLLVTAGFLLAFDGSSDQATETFAGVEAVRLDLDDADVELVAGDRATVSREVRTGRFGGTATAVVRDGTLEVSYRCPWFAGLWFGLGCTGDYQLVVPPGVEVVGRTENGDLRVTGLGGRVDLASSNGDVHLADTTGRVAVHTSNGQVTGSDLASTHVEATTSNGEVVLGFGAAPDRVRVDTSNGSVEVVVPDDGADYAIQPSTSDGEVRTDVPTDPSSSRRLALHTSNGDLTVRPAR